MKIVFLDIDGVLNSREYLRRRYPITATDMFDPGAVSRLNQITSVTGASIVVSSSWRYGYVHDLPGLVSLLRSVGVEAPVVGMTPVTGPSRGAEIAEWLEQNPDANEFVIIDDFDDMGNLSSNLVLTHAVTGLLDEHIARAIDVLGMEEKNRCSETGSPIVLP